MSLLLDALKKSEEAGTPNQSGLPDQSKQPGHTRLSNVPADGSPGVNQDLTLEAMPQLPAHKAPATDRNTSNKEITSARLAGQNLFAAKTASKSTKFTLGIVPIAVISGLFFAMVGGVYLWLEISTPPTPQIPRRVTVPVTSKVAAPELPAPISAVPESSTATTFSSVKQSAEMPLVDQPSLVKSDHTATALPKNSKLGNIPTATRPERPAQIHRQRIFTPGNGNPTDNIGILLAEGYRAYSAGDVNTAAKHYQTVLRMDDKNRNALLGMAAIAQQQQNDGLAIQYYNQVLVLDPRDPAAYAAMTSLNPGNPAVAESRLKLLLTHRPHAGILYFALGNVYADQSRWSDAQQAYFNAVTREPENAQFNFNLAVSLDHLGRNNTAAQYYRRAMQLDQAGIANFNHAAVQQRLQKLATP